MMLYLRNLREQVIWNLCLTESFLKREYFLQLILQNQEPEEEEDIDPADVKIFGMKRHVFQLTCLGAAVGYILCGLVGILSEKMQGTGLGDILAKSPSTTVWAVVVAAVGYFIGSRLEKKREAALADEQAALEQSNDTNA